MKIELGKRYKTRNGRIAFICLHDERNAKKYRLAEFWQVKIISKTTMIYHGLNLVNAQITEEKRITPRKVFLL